MTLGLDPPPARASPRLQIASEANTVAGRPARAYAGKETVGSSYDSWTLDGILEYYWGDHIHLGSARGRRALRKPCSSYM